MGRAFTYVIFFTMLLIVLEFLGFGFFVGNALSTLIGFNTGVTETGIDFSETGNNFIIAILLMLSVGVIAGGIIIGIITRSQPENYIFLTFITGTAVLFADVIGGLLRDLSIYPTAFAAVIVSVFLTMGVGYFITMAEWFRGNV